MPKIVAKNILIYEKFNKKIGIKKLRNMTINILIRYWKTEKKKFRQNKQ